MSIEAMVNVLNYSQATGRAKLVLIGIANHQGDNGAWPSIETLARYANSSERSVMRDIKELEDLGELFVERNAAPIRGQYRPNLYWVTIEQPGVTETAAGVTDLTSGVTDEVVRGDTVVTLNQINPKEPFKELNPQNKFEDEFNEFWDVYPKKVDKAPAFKAFMKAADKHGARTIIDGAARFANDPNLPFDKTFIKYPATWLNALGWLEGALPERERTKEELEALRVAQSRKKADADKAYTDKLLAEMKEAENRVKVDPPRICEHGRVAVICMECSRLKVRPNS